MNEPGEVSEAVLLKGDRQKANGRETYGGDLVETRLMLLFRGSTEGFSHDFVTAIVDSTGSVTRRREEAGERVSLVSLVRAFRVELVEEVARCEGESGLPAPSLPDLLEVTIPHVSDGKEPKVSPLIGALPDLFGTEPEQNRHTIKRSS